MTKINYVASHSKDGGDVDGGGVFVNHSIKPWYASTPARRRIMYFLVRYLRRETRAGRGFFLRAQTGWGWMWMRYGETNG